MILQIWKAVASVRGSYKLHAATVIDQEYGLTNVNPLERRGYSKWLLGDTSKDRTEVFLHSPIDMYKQQDKAWIRAYQANVDDVCVTLAFLLYKGSRPLPNVISRTMRLPGTDNLSTSTRCSIPSFRSSASRKGVSLMR